jgi:hypothetical protein
MYFRCIRPLRNPALQRRSAKAGVESWIISWKHGLNRHMKRRLKQ